jgi:hypothetical protein
MRRDLYYRISPYLNEKKKINVDTNYFFNCYFPATLLLLLIKKYRFIYYSISINLISIIIPWIAIRSLREILILYKRKKNSDIKLPFISLSKHIYSESLKRIIKSWT